MWSYEEGQERKITKGVKETSRGDEYLIILKMTTHVPQCRLQQFTIARTWKQPIYPPADEWIGKFWYIYTMEYYSAFKKKAFESVLMSWLKLEPIIQSEVSQKEKHQ